MEKLRQLFYLSRADTAVTSSDVRQILQVSQRNNRQNDITGCLLYSGRHFAQILEGESEALDALVTRIAADKRHTEFVIVIDREVEKRRFPSWSMGVLYKLDIEEQLEELLAGTQISEEGTVNLFDEMKPDTIMGTL